MKVAKLIELLEKAPKDVEVWVADNYEGNNYHGDFTVEVTNGVDGKKFVELEIGGLLIN